MACGRLSGGAVTVRPSAYCTSYLATYCCVLGSLRNCDLHVSSLLLPNVADHSQPALSVCLCLAGPL